MKLFKVADLYIQAIAFIGPCIYSIFTDQFGALILVYLFVGGSQVLSFIIHSILRGPHFFHKERRDYGLFLLSTIIIGILAIPFFLYFFLLVLLFFSPAMAVWYFSI